MKVSVGFLNSGLMRVSKNLIIFLENQIQQEAFHATLQSKGPCKIKRIIWGNINFISKKRNHPFITAMGVSFIAFLLIPTS